MSTRLSALDATFLHFERGHAPLHVAGLYIFEAEPEVEGPGLAGLFSTIESRLGLLPRYRQRVLEVPFGAGQPMWVDDPDFDLAYHLRRAALPAPGGTAELLDYVARVHARPLDRSKPLWETYVIEGLEGSRVALYSKFHHAMIDGASGIDLSTILFDPEPAGATAPPRRRFRPAPLPSSRQLLADALVDRAAGAGRALRSLATHPGEVPGAVAGSLGGVASLRQLTGMLRAAPRGPLNARVGRNRRIALETISLARAKAVKNVLGGTVNDVVLAAVGEAVDQYLEHHGLAHEEQVYRVMVPVSLRAPEERMALGNQVTAVFVDLPVGPMPASRRLREVIAETSRLKSGDQGTAAQSLIGLGSVAPATLSALIGRVELTGQRLINLVVSNVPGVQTPLYAGGSRLLETYPLLPLAANLAVVVCVTSYAGDLYFGLVGDYDAVPDLDVLAAGLRRGFDRLERSATAGNRRRPQPRPTATPARSAARAE